MIKSLATSILAQPPIWTALRRRALAGDPVTILCYHTLSPDDGGVDGWTALRASDFRAQLADLQAHYEITDLDTALSGAGQGRPQAVITFDDGDRGLHDHLRPILQETGVPVTLYIATEQFETGRPFWFDRVVNALQGAVTVTLNDRSWELPATPSKARWAVLGQVLEALKQAPPDERDRLADDVAGQGSAPPDAALGPMTKDQLRELATMPGVTIGAHTHGHELLDQIPLEAAKDSMARSRKLLQDWTGQEVRHFAYPNGNHTAGLRAAARDLGFVSATILEERLAPRGTDPYALPRISIGRYDSRNRVRLRLAGF